MAKSKAKPLLDQLAEAYEAGDRARVEAISKRIAKKLDASNPAPKPQRRKGQGGKAPSGPVVATDRPTDPLPPDAPTSRPEAGESSYIATTLGPGGLANRGRRVGVDGRTRVEAQHVSMAGRQNINQFDQWMKEGGVGSDRLDRRTEKAEKIFAQSRAYTPRPGMPGASRPVAQKIQVYCGGCGRPYEVYPSEVMLLDGDSEYKCDRCVRRGR